MFLPVASWLHSVISPTKPGRRKEYMTLDYSHAWSSVRTRVLGHNLLLYHYKYSRKRLYGPTSILEQASKTHFGVLAYPSSSINIHVALRNTEKDRGMSTS